MKEKNVVRFFYDCPDFYFPNRTKLKRFIPLVFKKEKRGLSAIHYIFCTDEFLKKMNIKFLNHNNYTDILTFPLSEKGEPIVGEIYISIDRVKDNSLIFNTNFKSELLRVILHGALHLCGYEDLYESQKKKMRSKENFYLALFSDSVNKK